MHWLCLNLTILSLNLLIKVVPWSSVMAHYTELKVYANFLTRPITEKFNILMLAAFAITSTKLYPNFFVKASCRKNRRPFFVPHRLNLGHFTFYPKFINRDLNGRTHTCRKVDRLSRTADPKLTRSAVWLTIFFNLCRNWARPTSKIHIILSIVSLFRPTLILLQQTLQLCTPIWKSISSYSRCVTYSGNTRTHFGPIRNYLFYSKLHYATMFFNLMIDYSCKFVAQRWGKASPRAVRTFTYGN